MLRLKKNLMMDQEEAAAAAEEEVGNRELLKRTMSMMRLRKKTPDNAILFRPVRGPSMMRLRKRISQFRLKKAEHEEGQDTSNYQCLWNPTLC